MIYILYHRDKAGPEFLEATTDAAKLELMLDRLTRKRGLEWIGKSEETYVPARKALLQVLIDGSKPGQYDLAPGWPGLMTLVVREDFKL